MRDLYPTSHCIPMVALSEEYYAPFPNYLDNKSYQRVAEDGMHMLNHDFNETVELVCYDLSPFFIFFLFEREFLCRHHFFLTLPLCLLFCRLSLPFRIWPASIGNSISNWTMSSNCDIVFSPLSLSTMP